MRLSPIQKQVILDAAHASFGEHATVRLFGSRVDDNERGGDIDLLVECAEPVEDKVKKQCRMSAQIQMRLGEQKIDILVMDPNTVIAPIHSVAKHTGVEL